jgi:uncharacterized protein (TIGR03435 family)
MTVALFVSARGATPLDSFEVAAVKPSAPPAEGLALAGPRFEVASVKRSNPTSPRGAVIGGPGTSSPLRFTASNVEFVLIAMKAYGAEQMFEVECKLPWMMEERYEIVANVPLRTTKEQFQLMLQQLLQERLGMVAHRETRPMQGYRLVLAKSGPKLAKAGTRPDDLSGRTSSPDKSPVVVRNGVPEFAESARSGELLTLDRIILRGRSETMNALSSWLSRRLQAPVLNATGLEGEYDFSMTYAVTPDVMVAGSGRVIVGGAAASPQAPSSEPLFPSSLPPLWEAIQQQLGLKLERVKDIPVEVLVLEKANKDPTGN